MSGAAVKKTSRERETGRGTLRLLGSFRAQRGSGAAVTLTTRKARALLVHLALRPGQRHSRDKLTELLWGATPVARARQSFRQALSSVRKALGHSSAIVVDADGVTLNASALDVDVPRFERLAAKATPGALKEAISLYAGDLLEGFQVGDDPFDDWLRAERQRLRDIAIQALTRLLAHQTTHGAIDDAVATATRMLTIDPAVEVAHRALMQLYARQGRRAAALAQYQTCTDLLQRTFDLEPDPETKRVYQQLVQHGGKAARPSPSRARSGIPLVGRAAEVAELRRVLHDVDEGRGRVVIVRGEAGIGKSRLVEELTNAALERRHRVLLGRCYESEQILPFAPWVDALRAADVAADRVALNALKPAWRSAIASLLPELGAAAAPPADHQDWLRLFDAVLHLVREMATRHAIAIFVEDTHWADDMSLRLFAFLARRLHTTRVLLVATVREEELVDAAAARRTLLDLHGDPHVRELRLSPLTRAETEALARTLGGTRRGGAEAARLGERLWAVSRGNPFVIVEMMRSLDEGGATLPARVQEVVRHRLDRLGASARGLVTLAAIIGREFEFDLLRHAADVSSERAAEAVEELVRRRILQNVGERFDFRHDYIRDVAAQDILPERRRLLHERVATALETLYGANPEPYYAAIAVHSEAAERWANAARYFQRAGDQAFVRTANRDAAVFFERSLAMLAHLPRIDDTLAQAVDTRLRLRNALWPIGELDAVLDNLRAAEPLARALGDPFRLGWVSTFTAWMLWLRGETAEAHVVADRARTFADQAGDVGLRLSANLCAGMTLHALGDFGTAEVRLRTAIALLSDGRERERFGAAGLPAMQAHAWLGWCLAERGEFDEAIVHGREAVRLADTPDHPWSLSIACWILGYLYLATTRIGEAVALAECGVSLCHEWNLRLWAPALTALLGYANVLSGRVVEGRSRIADALEDMATTRVALFESLALIHAAHARSIAGDHGAVEAAERAVALTRARHQRAWEAHALRIRADIAAGATPRDEETATDAYRAALAIARELGMRPLEAACLRGLA